VQQNTLLG